jgi:hypothetical protein
MSWRCMGELKYRYSYILDLRASWTWVPKYCLHWDVTVTVAHFVPCGSCAVRVRCSLAYGHNITAFVDTYSNTILALYQLSYPRSLYIVEVKTIYSFLIQADVVNFSLMMMMMMMIVMIVKLSKAWCTGHMSRMQEARYASKNLVRKRFRKGLSED